MSTNVGVDTATAAARRRQRLLRSWLRHERMTVAMTLAEKLHHTSRGPKNARVGEEAGLVTHSGLRAPTPLPSGMWPEPLAEPLRWFISGLEALCPDDGGAPSLSLRGLAERAAEVVDSSSLRFLAASALEPRRKEEEEKKKEKEKRRSAVRKLQRRWSERVSGRSRRAGGGRGRRGGRGGRLRPPPTPLVAALVVDTGGCTLQAGFLLFTLCSLLTLAGLSCQASLSVWSRLTVFCARRRLWQWHMLSWFCWYFYSLCVPCCL